MSNNHISRGTFPSIRIVAVFFLLSSVTLGGELAVVPSCSADAVGSTSCNIGINPIPTLGPILDGGYQWLTQETVTYTVFGLPIIEHTEVFTATETNFLDVTTITTTDTAGVTVTNIETQYVSFITATPSVNGVPAAAIVAGVVIAPALIASLQTIADAAAGKTLQQIIVEITAAFGLKKATIASGDVQTLADYLYYAVGGAAAVGGIVVVLKPVTIAPFWTATTIPTNGPSFTTTSSSSTSSPQDGGTAAPVGVSSTEPVYTAIMKYPYTAWQAILAIPPPTATFPTSPSRTPTASCHASNIGIDPGIANELALFFCNQSSLDFSKSGSKDVFGSNLTPPVSISSGVFVHFDYKNADGTCALSCWENYDQMIKSCQYDSHSINGIANIADACGTYAMTVTSGSIAPEPTASPRPLVERTCVDHSAYVSFSRDNALDAISKFCSTGITLPVAAQPWSRLYRYPDVTLNVVMTWSLSGQSGCSPYSSSQVSLADCVNYCTQAVDLCDTTDGTTKYGAKPLTWSSPNGCIDISIYGTHA